jgi:hypothetical protein
LNRAALLRWLSSPQGLGWPLALIVAVNTVATGYLNSDASLLGTAISPHLLDLLSGALCALVILGGGLLVGKSRHNSLGVNMLVWILAGVLANVVPTAVALAAGAKLDGASLLVAMLVGLVNLPLICALYTLLLGAWSETRATGQALATQQARLLNLEANLNRQVESFNQQTGKRANQELSTGISHLIQRIGAMAGRPATDAKSAIQELVDETVRPLSWKIESSAPKRFGLSAAGAIPANTWHFLRGRVPVGKAFLPELNTLVLLAFDLTYSYFVFGWPGVPSQLVTIIASFMVFKMLVGALGRFELPVWAAAAASGVVAYGAGWVFVALQTVQAEPHLDDAWGIPIHQAQVAVLVSLVSALIASRLAAIQNLEEVNLRLTASVTNLRQAVWANLRSLARFVHGSVQNRLLQLYISITDADTLTDQQVADLIEKLQQLGELPAQPKQNRGNPTLALGVIEALCTEWDPDLPIRLRVSTDARAAMEANQLAADCTVQVVQEAMNNAMKYAAPGGIGVTIEREGEALVLRVTNHTQLSGAEPARGYGTQTLDYLASSWDLKLANGLAELVAHIPLGNL